MIHHIFEPSRVEFDINSKPTSSGDVRTTLIHNLTGHRFECLSEASEEAVMKDIAALRSDAMCVLRCIFVDFMASMQKSKILADIRTAADNGDDARRPLHHHLNAKKYAASLGSALVSAYLPLEGNDEIEQHPEWVQWNGKDFGETYGRPTGLSSNEPVAILTRDRRIITLQAGAIGWRHHQDPWDIIAYSNDRNVIEVARDFQKVTYG